MERKCQNCKNVFQIEKEDLSFYDRIGSPSPTWCFMCRLVRRMSYRNERTLYRRVCQAPGHNEEIISVFSPEKGDVVFCQKAWWGDSWDGLEYGRDYDFSVPFFVQMRELWKSVPDLALLNINSVNSEYCSITEGNKNCYLVIGGDFNEDVSYSAFVFNSRDVMDSYWLKKCEFCYETTESTSCNHVLYSNLSEGCFDSMFLYNCKNCSNCFGCVNLRNKSYCIWNEQYTKEEYEIKIKEFNIENYDNVLIFKKCFKNFVQKFPKKYARILSSRDCTGDNIEHAKNVKNSFEVFDGAQDSKYLWYTYSQIKDSYDLDHTGRNTELCYEGSTLYPAHKVLFSRFIFTGHDIEYSYNCHNCSYLFGCVGLRDKQYCIFNKQYSKEKYETLVSKIKKHMSDLPYIDKNGIKYKYGEFFPIDLSPFAYNETVAMELVPLTREDILNKGYSFEDRAERSYQIDIQESELPKTINSTADDIIGKIISCAHKGLCKCGCTTAFKVTEDEFSFYKKIKIPLPHMCHNCRHYERISYKNPLTLWHRRCMNGNCANEFETSFDPNGSDIVFCEKCYQQEVL